MLCKFYCHLKDEYLVGDPLGDNEKPLSKDELEKIVSFDDCTDCIKLEIIDGIIYHENFEKLKWFIIDREIPVLFPVELREKKTEKDFLKRYAKETSELGITLE